MRCPPRPTCWPTPRVPLPCAEGERRCCRALFALQDINYYDGGVAAIDTSTNSVTNLVTVTEGGTITIPITLTAPSDQEVTVNIFPERVDRLRLSATSLTFLPGEMGPQVTCCPPAWLAKDANYKGCPVVAHARQLNTPSLGLRSLPNTLVLVMFSMAQMPDVLLVQMITLTVPEDGRTFGDLTTSIEFVTSSVSPGYDRLATPVTVQVIENRMVGIEVRLLCLLRTTRAPPLCARSLGWCRHCPGSDAAGGV